MLQNIAYPQKLVQSGGAPLRGHTVYAGHHTFKFSNFTLEKTRLSLTEILDIMRHFGTFLLRIGFKVMGCISNVWSIFQNSNLNIHNRCGC